MVKEGVELGGGGMRAGGQVVGVLGLQLCSCTTHITMVQQCQLIVEWVKSVARLTGNWTLRRCLAGLPAPPPAQPTTPFPL